MNYELTFQLLDQIKNKKIKQIEKKIYTFFYVYHQKHENQFAASYHDSQNLIQFLT